MSLLDDRTQLRSLHSAHRRPVRRAEGHPVKGYLLTCRLIKQLRKKLAEMPPAERYGFWQLPDFDGTPIGDRSIECVCYRIEQAGSHMVAALIADLETCSLAQVVRRALDTRKAQGTPVTKKRKAQQDDE